MKSRHPHRDSDNDSDSSQPHDQLQAVHVVLSATPAAHASATSPTGAQSHSQWRARAGMYMLCIHSPFEGQLVRGPFSTACMRVHVGCCCCCCKLLQYFPPQCPARPPCTRTYDTLCPPQRRTPAPSVARACGGDIRPTHACMRWQLAARLSERPGRRTISFLLHARRGLL